MPGVNFKTVSPFLFLFLFIISCHAWGLSTIDEFQPKGLAEQAVIVDTDLAFDDRLAILFLLKQPKITIKAITVRAADEEDCKQKMQELQFLLALTQKESMPLACSHALKRNEKAVYQPAMALLASVLPSSPQKVTILAIGPLTNLAETFKKFPALKERVEGLVIMGGAVHVPGNVRRSIEGPEQPMAEWNFHADPAATNLVLGLKVPITLVPLDATNQVPISDEFIEGIKSFHPTPQTTYVLNLLNAQHKSAAGRLYFWDLLAAAVLEDESLAGYERVSLRVIEDNGPARGQVISDPAGPKVRVAFRIDRERFERKILEGLTSNPIK